jgi:hypothetical protein
MLRSVDWQLVTDVSKQLIGSVFEDQAVKRMDCLTVRVGSHRLSRNVGTKYQSTPRNIPEEEAWHYVCLYKNIQFHVQEEW